MILISVTINIGRNNRDYEFSSSIATDKQSDPPRLQKQTNYRNHPIRLANSLNQEAKLTGKNNCLGNQHTFSIFKLIPTIGLKRNATIVLLYMDMSNYLPRLKDSMN